jgi:hypothetical protein
MPSVDVGSGGLASAGAPARRSAAWMAAALAFALSPILVDLVAHVADQPWARYALVFPPLALWRLRRAAPTARAPGLGWTLVGAALVLELVTVGGGVPRFGRPAIPLAVAGLCRALGLAGWAPILLACWVVPAPHALSAQLPLPDIFAELAAALVGGVALEPGTPPRLLAAAGTLVLRPHHGGVPLAALLSGLGWLAGLRVGGGLAGCARRAALLGLAALPVALLSVLLAAAVLAAGSPRAASWTLEGMPWVVGGALGLAAVLRAGSEARRP